MWPVFKALATPLPPGRPGKRTHHFGFAAGDEPYCVSSKGDLRVAFDVHDG